MVRITPATAADVDFMWQMLYYASYTHHEDGVTVADMRQNPDLIRHLDGWMTRPGDRGVIARIDDGPVGACWLRHLVGHEQADVSFVDDATPELVIAVEPDLTGTGIGTQLLDEMLRTADANGVAQIVLTARAANPAVSLYARCGFVVTERITNRVGTESVKMVRAGQPSAMPA